MVLLDLNKLNPTHRETSQQIPDNIATSFKVHIGQSENLVQVFFLTSKVRFLGEQVRKNWRSVSIQPWEKMYKRQNVFEQNRIYPTSNLDSQEIFDLPNQRV